MCGCRYSVVWEDKEGLAEFLGHVVVLGLVIETGGGDCIYL
jgi:hypothetical protein